MEKVFEVVLPLNDVLKVNLFKGTIVQGVFLDQYATPKIEFLSPFEDSGEEERRFVALPEYSEPELNHEFIGTIRTDKMNFDVYELIEA